MISNEKNLDKKYPGPHGLSKIVLLLTKACSNYSDKISLQAFNSIPYYYFAYNGSTDYIKKKMISFYKDLYIDTYILDYCCLLSGAFQEP